MKAITSCKKWKIKHHFDDRNFEIYEDGAFKKFYYYNEFMQHYETKKEV